MREGYIKLDRKILGSGILKCHTAWVIFGYMLLSASWRREQVDGVMLEPGELLSTYQEIADDVGLTYKQTRTGIEFLRTRETLGTRLGKSRAGQKAGEKTIFTLIKWHEYQGTLINRAPQRAHRRAASGHDLGKPSILVEEGKNTSSAHAHGDSSIANALQSAFDLPDGFEGWTMAAQVAYWAQKGGQA